MDVRLSAEQRALRDAAVQLVDRLGPGTVGGLADDERALKLGAAFEAAGWRDLRAAGDDGRPWASGVEVAIVAEEVGRTAADAALLGPTLAADLRRRSGAEPSATAETVLLDRTLGALVRTTGAPPTDAVAVDARGAEVALLLLPDADGARLATIPLGEAVTTTDLTRAASTAAAVPPTPLAGRALTDDDLAAWTALGLATACADLVGTMTGAVDLAVGYAAERSQYGRPVGSFQAVQHLLADAHVATEGSRSITRHAAWAVDGLAPTDALVAASAAKAYCARAARTVCETAIQVHGGIGNTWECLAHVHLRRALLSTAVLGDVDASLARVAAHRGIGGDGGLR